MDNVNNSLVYYIALKNAGVPVEMHLYAQGGHALWAAAHEVSDYGMASVGGEVAWDNRNDSGVNRTRHERASLLSCVGEPLKRIYKASQEKKERTSPRVPKWFLFFHLDSTRSCVSETNWLGVIALYKTAFVFALAFALLLCSCVSLQVRVISRGSNHLCEQLCAHEAKYALSF